MSAARFLRAKVIGVVLLASALVIAIVTIVPRGEGAPQADSADVGELTEVATNHFARLATIMVEGRNVAQNSYDFCEVDSIEPKVNGVLFSQAVENHRQELAQMGEKYSSSRSDVTIDSIVPQADGTIRAVATETTFLTTEGSGIETGYSTRHNLVFSPTPGGGWKLLHDEYLEPTGLLPLGEAESLVSSRP